MEGLTRVKGLRVPMDLDGNFELQCDEETVFQFPVHKLRNGDVCPGSLGLEYSSHVTEGPNGWTGNCRVCGQ